MNDQPQKTAAHEVIQYVSMWIDRHDPEFAKHVALKSVAEIIPLVNRRYKTNIGPNPKPYEFLWSFAVGQARYIDSVAMSKRVQAHKGRAEKAEQMKKKEPIDAAKKEEKPLDNIKEDSELGEQSAPSEA